MDFLNKAAIATGAASGMGLCFSEEWVKQGGNVLMCDVNKDILEQKVAQVNALNGGKAVGFICDVRDYEQVCKARYAAVNEFGSIDVVVNFAGGIATRMCGVPDGIEFPEVPIEVYDWGIDVNLKGPMYFAHAVMKQMREQKSGLIVNIGSIAGMEGAGRGVDYPTSKAGIMFGLTKAVAQCGAPYGVRCVCVSPGPVLTRPMGMKTLLNRAAEPKEIIDLILFIASDKGQFINGENIMIDGGRNAMPRES